MATQKQRCLSRLVAAAVGFRGETCWRFAWRYEDLLLHVESLLLSRPPPEASCRGVTPCDDVTPSLLTQSWSGPCSAGHMLQIHLLPRLRSPLWVSYKCTGACRSPFLVGCKKKDNPYLLCSWWGKRRGNPRVGGRCRLVSSRWERPVSEELGRGKVGGGKKNTKNIMA